VPAVLQYSYSNLFCLALKQEVQNVIYFHENFIFDVILNFITNHNRKRENNLLQPLGGSGGAGSGPGSLHELLRPL